MNFDRIAPHYHRLEILFAGGLMQRCRTTYLSQTDNCRRALLVGEGTGRFLAELLRRNPHIRVTCIEHSAGMIRKMRERLQRQGLDTARVEFKQMDAREWQPPAEKFDLVATHFFLDCFPAGQLTDLVRLLAASADDRALWLVTDFRVPERGWQKWRARMLIAGLYAFFQLVTALPAKELTPPDAFLIAVGFKLQARSLKSFGFAHADLWRRSI